MSRLVLCCFALTACFYASEAAAQPQFAPEERYSMVDGAWRVSAVDLDGDGADDMVTANIISEDIRVRINDGTGSFGASRRTNLSDGPWHIVAGDFNEDGARDLAVLLRVTLGLDPVSRVSIMLGDGGGKLRPPTEYEVGSLPWNLAVADFDNDGHEDLITANYRWRDLSLLRGVGDGTFLPALSVPTPFNVSCDFIVAADFNGDRTADIATFAKAGLGHVRVALGNGDGTFTDSDNNIIYPQSRSMTVGDFNGDDALDIALLGGDGGPAFVRILEGRGDGTFVFDSTTFTVGDGETIDVGDFDADGLLDVVVANDNDDDFSLLLGLGDLTFAAQLRYAAGTEPRAVAVSDLTGDGRGSVFVANVVTDDVSVYRNTGPIPPLPPVADAGPAQVVEATSPEGALILLDGSASTDPNSTQGTNDDIVLFEWIEDLGTAGEMSLGTGETLQFLLPTGVHDITLQVTDNTALSDTDDVVITVLEQPSPDLTLDIAPAILWPPNHRLVDVIVTLTPGLTCGSPQAILQSVTNSEPDDASGGGDGNTGGDIRDATIGTQDLNLRLRAERAAGGPGRIYTLVYLVSCVPGTETLTTLEAVVPHDQDGMVEPLMLSLNETDHGTLVEWTAVAGVAGYDVIRGTLDSVSETVDAFDLGSVVCIESGSTDETTLGFEDAATPAPGEVLVYFVEYRAQLDSGYGTERAGKPRLIGGGGCS